MKRSEMLKAVLDAVNDKFHGQHYTPKKIIDAAIKAAEKAGMLPPEISRYEETTIVDSNFPHRTYYHKCPVLVNEWEPEDE